MHAFIPLHISEGIHRTPIKGKSFPTSLWTPVCRKLSYAQITVHGMKVSLTHGLRENELQEIGREKK